MNKLVAGMAFAVAFSASARTLTWTGGDSGSVDSSANWTDVDGQTNAAPAICDRLIFSKGGTFTKDDSYLTLMGMQVTADAPVTLTGGKYTFETMSDGIAVTGSGEVTFESKIQAGYESGSTFALNVASGATVSLKGVVSGACKIQLDGLGTVNLYADNTFTGDFVVDEGTVNAYSDGAFGTTDGKTQVLCNYGVKPLRSPQIVFHGITTSENFDSRTSNSTRKSFLFPENTETVFNGTVADSVPNYWELKAGAKVTFNGKVTLKSSVGITIASTAELILNAEGSNWSQDWLVDSGTLRIQKPMTMGSVYCPWLKYPSKGAKRYLECENALYYSKKLAPFVKFDNAGLLDLGGFDQTVSYLAAGSGASDAVVSSSGECTLHLTCEPWPSELAAANRKAPDYYGTLTGPISLSVEGNSQTQRLCRACSATGSITLTNRTAFGFVESATWAGTNVVVRGGATLHLECAPFSDKTVISLEDDSEDGCARLNVQSKQVLGGVVVNGQPLAEGVTYGSSQSGAEEVDDDHFSGLGMIVVGSDKPVVDTASWTGRGTDDFVDTVANWSTDPVLPTLGQGVLTATVAGGSRMTLDRNVWFEKLLFASGESVTNFEVAATGASEIRLGAGGLAFAATADGPAQTNVISAPLVLTASAYELNQPCAAGVLKVEGPVSQNAGVAVSLKNKGAGSLYLTGPASMPLNFKSTQGKLYLKGEALGTDGGSTVIDQTSGASEIHFLGGTFASRVDIIRYGNNNIAGIYFEPGTTNVFKKAYRPTTNYGFTQYVQEGASIVCEGGFRGESGSHWHSALLFAGDNELIVTNEPFCYDGPYTGRPWEIRANSAKPVRIQLSATNNVYRTGIAVEGNVTVQTTVDGAFAVDRYPTALYLLENYGIGPTIDLCGTTQTFGSVLVSNQDSCSHTAKATVTSAAPGLLRAVQNGSTASVTWKTCFTGAAGFEKLGTNAVVLASVSPTAGLLAVSDGTLSFSGDGAWTNCSAVAVSGGTLKVDRKGRLAKGAAYTLTGGALEIAAGVRLKGSSLTLPDGSGGMRTETVGVFSAANCPYISGEGELVLQTGTVILVK